MGSKWSGSNLLFILVVLGVVRLIKAKMLKKGSTSQRLTNADWEFYKWEGEQRLQRQRERMRRESIEQWKRIQPGQAGEKESNSTNYFNI